MLDTLTRTQLQFVQKLQSVWKFIMGGIIFFSVAWFVIVLPCFNTEFR